MKKFPSTQEMAGIFPPWAKIRRDDQSIGYTVLNSLAYHVDKMDKTLFKQERNTFLQTVNLDEIDTLFKVLLPAIFEFTEDTTDPNFPVKEPPVVSGYVDNTAYLVEPDRTNSVEEFWYNAIPDRHTIDNTVSGEHVLLTFNATEAPLEVELTHHLNNGTFWFESSGGANYLRVENAKFLRARIIIRGVTRAGLEDSETLVFPWESKQRTYKEWKLITKIEVFDMEDDVNITVRSGDYDNQPYLDSFNLAFSDNRRKIDTFWGLGTVEGNPTLDLITFQSDEWEVIVAGYPDKQIVQSWETLDQNNLPVTGIDLAMERFSNRGWIVTADAQLHYYDFSEDIVSGVDLLKPRTSGAHIDFDYDTRYLIKDEYFTFTPWHARPLKEINSYRIWYQTPSGTKYGILNGATVSYSSNFTVVGRQFSRTIDDRISIQLTERGEYLFVIEATFIDGEVQQARVIAKTCSKTPLASLDLSADITSTVSGLDFDSDQTLWVRDITGAYYQIGFHYDTMLVDYNNKILYFREEYDSVDVLE